MKGAGPGMARWTRLVPLLLAALCMTALFGCGGEGGEERGLVCDSLLEQAAPAAAPLLDGYTPMVGETYDLFSGLARGDGVICFDVQARSAGINGIEGIWHPVAPAAVVIGVDRNRTDARITSWEDLLRAGLPVSFSHDMTLPNTGFNAMVLAAISYGLEGEDYRIEAGLDYLARLHELGLLTGKEGDTPVVLCLDYECAGLEPVIPTEGTLCYEVGILSRSPLTFDRGEAACLAGLGQVDLGSAAPVEDLLHFLTQTSDASRRFQREVMDIRHGTSADHREHVLAAQIFLLLALFWIVRVLRRTMRRDIRLLALLLCCVVVGWTLLRLFKWQLPTLSTANRLCWYSFYLFELLIPCILLWLALIIDRPDRAGLRPPKGVVWLLALYVGMMGVIYTNDLHRLVWQFDLAGDWNNDYTYGPVFYLVTVYNYGVLFGAIALLFRKGFRAHRRLDGIFPLFTSTLMVAYTVAYVTGVPPARNGDMTITTCALVLLFFESAMHTGLVPMNTHYREMFLRSPLKMQLLDREGRSVLRSPAASPVPPALWEQLREARDRAVEADPDTLMYATRIRSGMVVWEEDIRSLNLLRKDIERSIQTLSTANRLLQQEEAVRRRMIQSRIGGELLRAMEEELEEKTDLLSHLINDLPESADHRCLSTRIILLLCHIKRRGSLFFMAYEGAAVSPGEFSVYVEELCELVGYQGTRAVASCGLKGELEAPRAALYYDVFYEVLDWAVEEGLTSVLTTLAQEGEGPVFRLLCQQVERPWQPSPSLRRAIEEAGGSLSCKDLEESLGITVLFSREKEVGE